MDRASSIQRHRRHPRCHTGGRYTPETSGSGIPHLKAVLHRLRELSWFRVLIVKLFGGALAIGSGLVLGREGPTMQMGGTVGKGIAGWLHGYPSPLSAAGITLPKSCLRET